MDFSLDERRCLNIGERQTCVELERDFWECLESIAEQRGETVDELAREVGSGFNEDDLAAALRVFVLGHFQSRSARRDLYPDIEGIVERKPVVKSAFKQKYH
jgi:predicted DNA-binding ribbon-helix-helix protein